MYKNVLKCTQNVTPVYIFVHQDKGVPKGGTMYINQHYPLAAVICYPFYFTFICGSRVTLGHMQLTHGICIAKKVEFFCRGSPSGICSYARHMHASVLALRG